MLLAYTLGKSTDDASGFFTSAGDPNFPQNSLDPAAEQGRSSFDVRHRFSASFAYELPLGSSVVLRDIEVQGIVTIQSGRPFTVALRPDIDNSNTGRSNLGFGYNDRPNVTGDPTLDSPDRRAVVQHRGVLAAGLRHVRQRRPQHPDRARLHERQPRGGEVRPGRRAPSVCSCEPRRSTC